MRKNGKFKMTSRDERAILYSLADYPIEPITSNQDAAPEMYKGKSERNDNSLIPPKHV